MRSPQALRAHWGIGLSGGAVVANPIPAEHEIAADGARRLDGAGAVRRPRHAGVHGKDVTPFLLARLHELSGGATEQANKELVYNNARACRAASPPALNRK